MTARQFSRQRFQRRSKGRNELPKNQEGFSLVELLVVISVISVLASLLVVGINGARGLARRAQCMNNLREIGMATQVFVTAKNYYPPAYYKDGKGTKHRWMDYLKPYLEKGSSVYLCPGDDKQIACTWDSEIVLSYGINLYLAKSGDYDHYFWGSKPDGQKYAVKSCNVHYPSRVILFTDCTPGYYYCGDGTNGIPVSYVAYRHLDRTYNAAFCDGHVETKTDTVKADWDAAQ
jgi:prepilin-type N-terminal cleavage/methylation domain-containing protein/prepilin-type processing-associated H-X9-DG protein